ncbi:MAG TPA: PQQ-dependent sugar dehydrogenase [Planctomycetaceae bacterium]
MCAYPIHGEKFGLGFGVATQPGSGATVGSYSWGGIYHTFFWVDPEQELVAVLMTQLFPWGDSTLWADFQKSVYAALAKPPAADKLPESKGKTSSSRTADRDVPIAEAIDLRGRFLQLLWFEKGIEHGNPTTNGRFRVNDPLAALHPEFGKRSEPRGNGLMQIELTEPLARIAAAEVALELWGGHPGTANKRVAVNGRTTYAIPEIGTASGHCTHQYPVIRLERSDLVQAHNAFQFACDRGDSFWGHFIVDNACLRVELDSRHPALDEARLQGFRASVVPRTSSGPALGLAIDVPPAFRDLIAAVDFQGYYEGFDENGDGRTRDWHGMTKNRRPCDQLGTAEETPFAITWDTTMLASQSHMAARAVVHFKTRADIVYLTPPLTGLATPPKDSVLRFAPAQLRKSFWSRVNRKQSCEIPLDAEPRDVAAAELRVVVWDGGADKIEAPLSWNGHPLTFHADARHDVRSLRLAVDPHWLQRGKNVFELISDTEHHGIEVLLPGPELFVRLKSREAARAEPVPESKNKAESNPAIEPSARLSPARADEQRRAATNSGGNAQRGKQLFASGTLKCEICHKVAGKGGEAGPDLSLVAGKLDRTHLIESLLDPSAQILEGFRTTTVVLNDGRTLSGIVVNETGEGFTLIDSANKPTQVARRDVEERGTSPLSLMPADLTASLSPAEFTDLIAYLETLHSGRRPSPGEGITGVVTLPEGFVAEPIAGSLTGCTAFDVAPDGRVFVCEQTGALRVVKEGRLLAEPFIKLNVTSTWERGLIGVTLDPDFPRTPHVYVCCVAGAPYPHHVVSRLTAEGDRAVPGSEVVLFEGDDQTKLGGDKPDGHQGGALHFGRDGKLYVAIGDQTAGAPAQKLDSLQGKILRLNSDGSIPDDNPFYRQTQGKYRAIWALGLRNPFMFAVHPRSGRIFINDVGGRSEEINEGIAGANFGWPANDHGPTTDSRFRGPVHYYPTACITGGAFAPDELNWPAQYRGKYFFADFNHGFIRTLDPERPAQAAPFAGGLRRPVDLRFGPDGTLYVLLRNAWVIDGAFKSDTGALVAIHPGSPPSVAVNEETLFGDMECLVISTPAAKYYYGTRGAGFARILDPDGHDWISYRHGGQAAGEYRGLPKLGQPVKYFHCGYGFGQYGTTNPFRTKFTRVNPEHVRVESETQDGTAACAWDFYPTHAELTLKRIPGDRYWFLYEGTPGGRFDVNDDFSVRPGGKKTLLSEPWSEVVPWAAFGAGESPYALLCVNHQRGSNGDSFVRWPYAPDAERHENQMTVFGFGRPGWRSPDQHTPQLTGLPARFTIALLKADAVEAQASQLSKSPDAAATAAVPLEPGFESLFDGAALGKWDGDPKFWRVEGGAIVGATTAQIQPADGKNTFLIYRGREFADFELRFRYQVEGFNSGMQYRSIDRGQFHVDGLQADFEARCHDDPAAGKMKDRFSGMFFEENGRMFMAQRGEAVIVRANPGDPKKPKVEKIAALGDDDELEKAIRRDDWNDYTIVADGNVFTHIINGRVQTLAIDEDEVNFRKSGILALQLHSGKPMKIEVRDLRIRELPKRKP